MNKVKERAARIRELRKKMREREKAVFMKLGAKIRAYLFTGILVTAPVAITLYMTYRVVMYIDIRVGKLISGIIPEQYEDLNPVTIPGIGIVVLVLGFILIGMFAAGFMGRFFLKLGEWIVYKMPLISTVYSLLKQVFETFLSNKNNSFKQVVLFEYPRKGIWIYGFLSGETKGEVVNKVGKPMLNIFVPTTPNPTSGFLIFVPKEDVVYVDIPVEEALKFIISCGVVDGKQE
ncbi:MAG: DUF502 domain-containing protein [Lactobacillaceae bacterium]|jgi:uncharacterized membrane protein|nr:DUF502 domain-containing protein [Lactobacillaceae bacterium]